MKWLLSDICALFKKQFREDYLTGGFLQWNCCLLMSRYFRFLVHVRILKGLLELNSDILNADHFSIQ